ncbi:MAG: tetratricopeptide repeat protein [Synergistaceae bacterium]|nr:tetratricopeptide repeat protein [Synergistaceae bacterium]MBR1658663.1 tetratricopeptide repeat protein [Synergistaceae bacterium]
MNVAAFILAIAGAGLSLFQPVVPVMGLSFSDFLSAPNSDLKTAAIIVLVIAVIAAICGFCALMRKGIPNCVAGLAICGVLYLFSVTLFMNQPANTRNLPFDTARIAMSVWTKTFLVWALCYIAAAVCAQLDETAGTVTLSATSNPSSTLPSVVLSSVPSQSQTSSEPQDFEPVLGIETPALIKRGKIFLEDDDFSEAERYFEQALRQDPENSQAYLGKLMAQFRVHNIDELSDVSSPLSEQKLFKRALEFAGDDEKSAIQECLEANSKHVEQLVKEQELKALEEKYQEALRLKKQGEELRYIEILQHAEELLAELGDYKESESLIEVVKQQIQEENFNKMKTRGLIIFVIVAIVAIL